MNWFTEQCKKDYTVLFGIWIVCQPCWYSTPWRPLSCHHCNIFFLVKYTLGRRDKGNWWRLASIGQYSICGLGSWVPCAHFQLAIVIVHYWSSQCTPPTLQTQAITAVKHDSGVYQNVIRGSLSSRSNNAVMREQSVMPAKVR